LNVSAPRCDTGEARGLRAPLRRSAVSIDPASADSPKVIQVSRLLLLALLAWWTVGFAVHPLDGEFVGASFLHLINLPFHEAGHILFSPFGTFMTAFGGSLLQVLIPMVCVISFARRDDWFAAAVCSWWAGQNLIDLAPYIADARALQLVLLGGRTGAEVEGHDWEAILTSLGWLRFDRTLGYTAHCLGTLTMVSAIGVAGWITLGIRGSGIRDQGWSRHQGPGSRPQLGPPEFGERRRALGQAVGRSRAARWCDSARRTTRE